jgi:long-chain fatty acid transport protein
MIRLNCLLLVAAATFIVLLGGIEANAGAFAIREQDTVATGDASAGVAAGGSIGSMFWNPATMTQTGGGGVEVNTTAIFPNANQSTAAGSTLAGAPFNLGGDTNTTPSALLPSAYLAWQLNPNLWIGLAVNSPYGLKVRFEDGWAGRTYGLGARLATYDANPSLALRITDWLSFGFGAQVQYAKATLTDGLLLPPDNFIIKGSGLGYGYTAGLTVTPGPNTTVGVGWRSAIDQKLDGTLLVNAPLPATTGSIDSQIDLPNLLSVGIRQRFDDRWTAMGTVEWTNWSRIGTTSVTQPSGAPATIVGIPITLPFQYRDGWYYSIGAEYIWSSQTTLRAGIAYESSPITDQVRMPLLPDNNRISVSAGLSYKVSSKIILDASYLYVKLKNANINISPGSGNPWFQPPIAYVGEASADVSVFSVGLRYLFDTPAPALNTKG